MQLPDNKYSVANTNVLAGGSTNNLFAVSPKFADSTDVNGPDNIDMTVDDGLRLLNTSPCVNAGSNGFVPATITTDIAGSSRIQTLIVDMGAYEAPCIPTFSSFAVTACTSYFFNGNTLASSGAYKDTLVNAVGCDSIITLNLTVIGTSTLYVDSSIASSGNGISWATAIKNLDSALYLAWQCPNITVINVAKGTYKPTHLPFEMNAGRTGTEIAETDSRLKTFHLRTGFKNFRRLSCWWWFKKYAYKSHPVKR